jgi:hypothetical protein
MWKTTAATRLAVLKGAAVAGVLATAALVTGTASAEVFVLPVGLNAETNGANLAAAITTANSNGGSNTIVLGAGTYAPTTDLPAVTDPNLTITAPHAVQSVNGQGPIINGANTGGVDAPILTVNAGGGLTIYGIDIRTVGLAGGSSPDIISNGTLTVLNSAIHANLGPYQVQINAGSGTINDTLIADDSFGGAIDNESGNGTLNLNNDTISNNQEGALLNDGTTNLTNSILSNNSAGGLTNCSSPVNSSSNDADSDGSCIAPGDTTSVTGVTQTLGQTKSNGGPVV